MKAISESAAQQIAVDFLKKSKNAEKVNVASTVQNDGVWIVKGTFPLDLEGHPWAERFEIVVDQKGKIKSTEFSLL